MAKKTGVWDIDIVINGKQVKNSLNSIGNEVRSLNNDLRKLTPSQEGFAEKSEALRKAKERYKEIKEEIYQTNKVLENTNQIIAEENSLNSIGEELKNLKNEIANLTPGTEKFIKKSDELKIAKQRYSEVTDAINQTNISIDESSESLEETNYTLANVKDNFNTVFDGFLSGNPEKVKEGLQGIRGGLNGLLSSAKAFILTPIGAAITALVGIGAGLKSWLDFNIEVEKTNQQIQDITQTTGDATDAIRVRAEALKDVFGLEINESVNAAKSLAKGFGISYEEAFDQIENAAVQGKLKNDEFLDSVEEYPALFKNAGYSVSDFVNIVNTGIDIGIYKDKLPDALKEADLALKEQTKATKDALVNAFGAPFAQSILKRVKEGKITTKEALQEIAKQSEKVNLNQQQQAQLTADLFKSAGEDAGGAIKVLKAVNIALNEQQKPLTEAQKLRKEELETKKELKSITTQLFASGSEGIGKWIKKGKIFATQTLIKILKGGVSLYNWFVDLNNQSTVFSTLLTGIGSAASSGFKVLGSLLKNAWDSFKGLGNVVVGVFTGDWQKIKEGFKQSVSFIPNIVTDVKNQVVKDANEIYDAFQGKNKMKRVDLKTFLSTETNEEEKNRLKAYQEEEEELIKLIEKAKKERALALKSGNESELISIAEKYAKLKEKFILSEEEKTMLTIEQIKAREDKINELLSKDNATETPTGKTETNNELTPEDQRILDSKKKLKEFLDEFDEGQKIQKQLEKLEADEAAQLSEELEIEAKYAKLEAEAYGEKELLKRLAEAKNQELQAIEDKFGKIKKEKDEKIKVEKEKSDAEHHRRQLLARRKLKNDIINGAIDLAGQETRVGQALLAVKGIMAAKESLMQLGIIKAKAATAVAEGTMATTVGAANTAKVGFPQNIPLLIGFAAQTVGIISAIKNATSMAKSVQGFEKGLYPVTRDDGKKFKAKLGGPTRTQIVSQPTLMQEYLVGERRRPEMIIDDVTYSKLDPRIIQYILDTHRGTEVKLPGFEKGSYPKSEVIEQVQEVEAGDNSVNALLLREITRLNQNLESGIEAHALIGDDEIEEFEQRKKLIINTKESAKIK